MMLKMLEFGVKLSLLICFTNCTTIDSYDSELTARKEFDPSDTLNTHALVAHTEGEVDSVRYLALGDSYTIGTGVSAAERWPNQLASRINTMQPTLYIEAPFYVAQNGWTTQALSNGMIAAGVDTANFDLVSLLIGVNNQYQGLSLAQYAEQFTDLLERAITIANGNTDRVFVVSIPDYGYTPFGVANQAEISAELAQFNASCASITASYGVAHYNITPISQQWPNIEGLIATDNLHPSGAQYSLWVDSFVQAVTQQIQTN